MCILLHTVYCINHKSIKSMHKDDHVDDAANVLSVYQLSGMIHAFLSQSIMHMTHLLLTKTCLPDPAMLRVCFNFLHC